MARVFSSRTANPATAPRPRPRPAARRRAGPAPAGSVTLAVVGDAGGVGPQVAAELADRFAQLALLGTGAVDVEVELEVFDGLQRPEDVAVPAERLEPCQLGGGAVGGRRRWGCAQALGELGQH